MALWKRNTEQTVRVLVDLDAIQGLLLQIDSATDRLEESVEKAAVAIRQLDKKVHEARVATREAQQAAETARQAARRTTGGRAW